MTEIYLSAIAENKGDTVINNYMNIMPASEFIYQSESIIRNRRYFLRMDSRIYYSMLRRTDCEANEFSETYIDIKDFFFEWESLSSHDYYLIKDSIEKFQDYTFWDSNNKKKKKLFDYIKYDYFSHEIVGKFSDDVKEDLLRPKEELVKIPFYDLVKIKKSKFSSKIYEFLCMFSESGSSSWMIPSREMAKILSEKELYIKQPFLMMKNIIIPSVKIITESIDGMDVSCEINRNKRIIFTITRL